MSIEKLDHVRLIQEKLPYTLHMNYVLQNVRHPLALAIWAYLTSLPPEWEVHRNQLMEHFEIGRDKLADALKYLSDNKLIEYVQDKKLDGKFGISHIIVKNGIEFEVIHRNATAPLKNRNTVLPDNGKTAAINTIAFKKENKYKNDPPVDNFKSKRQDTKTGELRCTLKFYEPGNPDYDRVHGVPK